MLYLSELQLAGGSEPVVVKVLDSRTTITPEIFDRLSRKWNEQAELLRFVHRPGESGTLSGRALVLVMNHVDGLDLRDWRAELTLATPAERREVMRTLEQLADVLDWLHSGRATPSGRQVVHGDLSPGNVMVDAHGQATLMDFGLSKLTADHRTAEVWFTPGYAAPEVFDSLRTPGTDRYAFGAIAYFLYAFGAIAYFLYAFGAIAYFLLSGESPPPSAQQPARAMAALPQFALLDAEERARITAVCAEDPAERPVNLAGWMKNVRRAVVSTTTSGSVPRAASLRDAAPQSPGPSEPTASEPGETAGTTPGASATPETSASGPHAPGEVKDSNVADLTVLSSVGRVDNFEVGSAKLNTKEYGSALLGSCYYGAAVEYDVNRAWSTLEFTAGVDDGSTMEQARVTISVDDRPALFSESVHLGKPVTESLDIRGALRLRIKVEQGCKDDGNAVLAAPVLKR
ncbi:protein kinase domain-containing protein [Streptomyces sp. JL4002]|uniref:protein kinase domain-containing protein n=1 Tax=Streptomyces sp. JL4002 TaxID=3404781 RepID=UPI003B28595F